MNYLNENDPSAAAWLRELIAEGHIAAGVVDERSIHEATVLYIVGAAPRDLPPMPLVLGEASHVIAMDKRPGRGVDGQRLRKGMPGWRPEVSKPEREHTPPALAAWLVDLARRCRVREEAAA